MVLVEGAIFDGRSIVLSLAGLFGGTLPTLTAMVIASAYRIYLGGIGVLTGVGSIIISGLLGIGAKYLLKKKKWQMTPLLLFVFGFVVHLILDIWFITFPREIFLELIRKVTFPYLTIFPFTTMLIGIFWDTQRGRVAAEEQLKTQADVLEEKVASRTRELAHVQRELFNAERLAMLGEIAGSVGHELRNPLSVIANAVYLLNNAIDQDDEKSHEYVDVIDSEVRNASQIINDLLDYARSQPASMAIQDIHAAVDIAINKAPPPSAIRISTDFTEDMLMVRMDENHISQVIENFLSNAYQAMPLGGEVIIKSAQEDDFAAISIIDTGEGIEEENKDKIFDLLFTTHPRRIGLGLALAKRLAESHNGKIVFTSTAGEGSTFTLLLPIL